MTAILDEHVMPEVGMGATLYYPDDRYPYTVIEVINDEHIRVQQDDAIDLSPTKMFHRDYSYASNLEGEIQDLFLDRYKTHHVRRWRNKEGTLFVLGKRQYYKSPG